MKYLTLKDELMLLAILKLEEDASLVKLREYLNNHTEKKWSVGNVFVSLDKLETNGWIEPLLGAPKAQRGGKAVKHYRVTLEGLTALRETKSMQDGLWSGLYETVFNETGR